MDTDDCPRCHGCGRIANDDDGSPWSAWESLPPGSDIAVRLGLVQPMTCPTCLGSGRRVPAVDKEKGGK